MEGGFGRQQRDKGWGGYRGQESLSCMDDLRSLRT